MNKNYQTSAYGEAETVNKEGYPIEPYYDDSQQDTRYISLPRSNWDEDFSQIQDLYQYEPYFDNPVQYSLDNPYSLQAEPIKRTSQKALTTQSVGNSVRKLFVGGLTGDTTAENLKAYFGQFTSVRDAMVVFDPTTKKSNGFGFVTLDNAEDLEKLLAIDPHIINGNKVDCKQALNKTQAKNKQIDERPRKIFVGGLPRSVSDSVLVNYFNQFGPVEKAYPVKDHVSGKHRGFGFVVFDDIESCLNTLNHTGGHYLYGNLLSIRSSVSRIADEKKKAKSAPDCRQYKPKLKVDMNIRFNIRTTGYKQLDTSSYLDATSNKRQLETMNVESTQQNKSSQPLHYFNFGNQNKMHGIHSHQQDDDYFCTLQSYPASIKKGSKPESQLCTGHSGYKKTWLDYMAVEINTPFSKDNYNIQGGGIRHTLNKHRELDSYEQLEGLDGLVIKDSIRLRSDRHENKSIAVLQGNSNQKSMCQTSKPIRSLPQLSVPKMQNIGLDRFSNSQNPLIPIFSDTSLDNNRFHNDDSSLRVKMRQRFESTNRPNLNTFIRQSTAHINAFSHNVEQRSNGPSNNNRN